MIHCGFVVINQRRSQSLSIIRSLHLCLGTLWYIWQLLKLWQSVTRHCLFRIILHHHHPTPVIWLSDRKDCPGFSLWKSEIPIVGACRIIYEKDDTYKMLVRKPKGKRPPERPKCGWEAINICFKEIGWEGVDWLIWLRRVITVMDYCIQGNGPVGLLKGMQLFE
jgi:hypothetical protein